MKSLKNVLMMVAASLLVPLAGLAKEGGGSSTVGGGGDASEIRVNHIRSDLRLRIAGDEFKDLRLPERLSMSTYKRRMYEILAPKKVIVGFVTTEQEDSSDDPELRVWVDGSPKTCRGFRSRKDSRLHLLCNVERFAATLAPDQYRLIHHEYAGLAGVERNTGAASDYSISDQIDEDPAAFKGKRIERFALELSSIVGAYSGLQMGKEQEALIQACVFNAFGDINAQSEIDFKDLSSMSPRDVAVKAIKGCGLTLREEFGLFNGMQSAMQAKVEEAAERAR